MLKHIFELPASNIEIESYQQIFSILELAQKHELLKKYHSLPADMQIIIGNNMRVLRKERGLTQMQLAQEVFCSTQTISALENGYAFANIETLQQICKYYNIFWGQLIFQAQIYCLASFLSKNGPELWL